MFQHGARRKRHQLAILTNGIMDNLCGWFIIPGHQPTGVWIRQQYHIAADFIQHLTVVIFASHRLSEHIFRKPQAAGILRRHKFFHRQDFTTRDAGNITDQAFDFGDGFIIEPFLHVESHVSPNTGAGPIFLFKVIVYSDLRLFDQAPCWQSRQPCRYHPGQMSMAATISYHHARRASSYPR